MDINALSQSLLGTLGETLPSVVGALVVLVVGWIVALLVRAGIRRGLGYTDLNKRVQSSTGSQMNLEGGIASGFYYLILLIVLIAFFNTLALERVSGSLQALVDEVLAFTPNLIAGGTLLLVAWVLAMVARALVTRVLASTKLDERLSKEADVRPISDNLGNVLYWLVILLVLPAVLGALGMEGLLEPVQGMVDQFLAILPNVLGAALIGIVGWIVARVLRDLVTNLLAATGLDTMGERAGLHGTTKLSGLIGLLVYIFVFVPALIAALNTLQIEAISSPATDMLGEFLAAIPNIFAAAIILAVAFILSSFIASLVTGLLGGIGFDQLPERIGLAQAIPSDTSPSRLVGRVVVFFVMLFATVEAAERLGFGQVSELVAVLIRFGANVLLGLVIISVGYWLSNLAYRAVGRVSGEGSAPIAAIVRFGILGIVIAMGLRAMGLANEIVNLAFGLTLGSVAVAIALSFGLGGREAAGRQMEHWLSHLRGEKAE